MTAPTDRRTTLSDDRHARIAMLAFARGMLQQPAFMEVMSVLGRDSALSLDEVWISSGRLALAQLEALLIALDAADDKIDGSAARDGSDDDDALPDSDGPSTAVQVPIAHFDTSQAPPPMDIEAEPPTSYATDRYVRLRTLGSGGMGDVFECMDHRLGRRVAVKMLRREHEGDPLAVAMLDREARVTGSLEHPNIIPVYDAGREGGTKPYYAMRLLPQTSLDEVLKKLRARDVEARREYTLGRLLRLFFQVCQAVEYAHSRNVIHCDLKPGNILLGSFGEVLVADWGLAYSVQDASTYRGGTPGYMAPEQLEPSPRGIDARTDVFALGAILYELVSHHSAFPDALDNAAFAGIGGGIALGANGARAETSTPPLSRPLRVPPAPSAIAPEKAIAPELDSICLRAIALDPDQRYASANELTQALEAFLEGTKERELSLIRAREIAHQAHELSQNYHELVASREGRVADVARLRATTATWDAPAQKRALWDAEDRREVLDALCIRTFQAAVTAYEQALEESPHLPEARRGLARLYEAEVSRAQDRVDEFDRLYFEGLVRQYPEQIERRASANVARLKLATSPGGMNVSLALYTESGRRLIASKTESLGVTPVTLDALVRGTYVVSLTRTDVPDGARDVRPVRHPFVLEGGQTISLAFDLHGTCSLAPGEVFIPGGPALLGGDPNGVDGGALHEIDVAPFVIDALPVSFGEYLAFLEETFRDTAGIDVDARTRASMTARHIPCGADGARYWEWDGTTFTPAAITRWAIARESLRELPVFGIDERAALAFAAWKSARTGRVYRLPRDIEWEKAGRGTDGRAYPWGNRFDATFCKMRESRAGLPAPEPRGAFEPDESPYGVRDIAGGIAEWVSEDARAAFERPREGSGNVATDEATRHVFSKGGAWCDWRGDCNLGARRAYFAIERTARVGFRLARDVAAGADGSGENESARLPRRGA